MAPVVPSYGCQPVVYLKVANALGTGLGWWVTPAIPVLAPAFPLLRMRRSCAWLLFWLALASWEVAMQGENAPHNHFFGQLWCCCNAQLGCDHVGLNRLTYQLGASCSSASFPQLSRMRSTGKLRYSAASQGNDALLQVTAVPHFPQYQRGGAPEIHVGEMHFLQLKGWHDGRCQIWIQVGLLLSKHAKAISLYGCNAIC